MHEDARLDSIEDLLPVVEPDILDGFRLGDDY